MTNGRCFGCGVPGRGKRNFLCEECVNPEGGMLVCRKCKRSVPLTLDDLRRFAELGMHIPSQNYGVVIALAECVGCTDKPRGESMIYTVKLS